MHYLLVTRHFITLSPFTLSFILSLLIPSLVRWFTLLISDISYAPEIITLLTDEIQAEGEYLSFRINLIDMEWEVLSFHVNKIDAEWEVLSFRINLIDMEEDSADAYRGAETKENVLAQGSVALWVMIEDSCSILRQVMCIADSSHNLYTQLFPSDRTTFQGS